MTEKYDEFNVPPYGEEACDPTLVGGYIQCLGFGGGAYYYFSPKEKQVVTLTAAQHCYPHFLRLAALSWWQGEFLGPDVKLKELWPIAANALMEGCAAAGVYDPDCVRGRGAWMDEGRVVMHLGDRLWNGGGEWDLDKFITRYRYNQDIPIHLPAGKALRGAAATLPLKIAQTLNWENELSAFLLAGWCVIAPICGALDWRPHIWITGAKSSGKTWVLRNIVHKLVGPMGFKVLSSTTEAGIRQTLKYDARPIVFDEIEATGFGAAQQIQDVLALARQASSETDAKMYKGSAGHSAVSFSIRSCFCMSSINVSLKQKSDESRVTVLELRARHAETEEMRAKSLEAFRLIEEMAGGLNDYYCAALLRRTLGLVDVIRANAGIFSSAVAMTVGDRRFGDQMGALLAGVYSLHKSRRVEIGEAMAWIKKHKIDSMLTSDESDDSRCLSHLLQYIVRVKGGVERSIGQMVDAAKQGGDSEFGMGEITGVLERYGLKAELLAGGWVLYIANSHSKLAEIYRGTPWADGWGRVLRQGMKGADNNDNVTVHFSGGVRSKVTRILLTQ